MPKTGRELEREVDEFLSAAGKASSVGGSSLRFRDADVERMFGRRGSTGDSAKIAILGDPAHAHRLRADYFRALRDKFVAEHQRLLGEAERVHGEGGTMLAAGLREHWPSPVKDRIRFAAQGSSTLGDAIRLHEALAKTRSPAFR